MENRILELEKKVQQLTDQLGTLEDINEIRQLHHKYGYYFDACLFEEVVELFDEDGEARFMGGIFKGKEGIKRLYLNRLRKNHTNGHNGPVFGVLIDHLQVQDVVTVSPDRKTAKGRFRCFSQLGRHELIEGKGKQLWEGGIYENEYVKVDGKWKIKVLDYRGMWLTDFHTGWAKTPPNLYPFYTKTIEEDPTNPHAPDALIEDPKPVLWPETYILPFHYPHPITGEWWDDKE